MFALSDVLFIKLLIIIIHGGRGYPKYCCHLVCTRQVADVEIAPSAVIRIAWLPGSGWDNVSVM